jgi:hypothetical protein
MLPVLGFLADRGETADADATRDEELLGRAHGVAGAGAVDAAVARGELEVAGVRAEASIRGGSVVNRRAGRWRRAEDVVHGAGRAAKEVVDASSVFVVVAVSAGAEVARGARRRGGEAALVVSIALHFAAIEAREARGQCGGRGFVAKARGRD